MHPKIQPKNKKPKRNQQSTAGAQEQFDWRQQLYNGRQSGPITKVQLPAEAITRLWGILLDLDPDNFRVEVVPEQVRSSPERFYREIVKPWLDRHTVLKAAEVRISGRGLHVILCLGNPIEIATDAERQRWSGIVHAIQAILPTDPNAPGITAVTRQVGSLNSKTGTKVRILKAAKPISAEQILALFQELRERPFRTVACILFGSDRVTPCPVCQKQGTSLAALDRVGMCYSNCDKVKIDQVYDVILGPRVEASPK